MKAEFKAIAMRCNQEQFEASESEFIKLGFRTDTVPRYCDKYPYLILGENKELLRGSDKCVGRLFIEEFDLKQLLSNLKNVTETTHDPVFIERYNITDKVKELLSECKKQGFSLDIDNGVIILKQI